MTHFLQDILRQPEELHRALGYLHGPGRRALHEAAAAARSARTVYVTAIGGSWHSALCAQPLFYSGGLPVCVHDPCELLHSAAFTAATVIVAISRSGRSIEIVNLLAKAREGGATVIGITCSDDGQLAKEAQIPILVPTKRDHGISVTTYTTLAAAVGALASSVAGSFDDALVNSLTCGISETAKKLSAWQEQVAATNWLVPGMTTYFLGRGCSLGTCHEARLLWEEGVKSPATAMGTGTFRHGPQEIVVPEMRFGMWIDAAYMREQDLAVVRDLRRLGAAVMLTGQKVPDGVADLAFQLPYFPAQWQFLVDIIPAQLCAERLARLSGVDSDSFRFCSYIVEDEYGLMSEERVAPKEQV